MRRYCVTQAAVSTKSPHTSLLEVQPWQMIMLTVSSYILATSHTSFSMPLTLRLGTETFHSTSHRRVSVRLIICRRQQLSRWNRRRMTPCMTSRQLSLATINSHGRHGEIDENGRRHSYRQIWRERYGRWLIHAAKKPTAYRSFNIRSTPFVELR